MTKQRENKIDYLGSALLIVLFFFFACGFSNKPVKRCNINVYQHEQIIELHSKEVAVVIAQPPSYQKSQVSLIDKMNFKFFNDHFKILQDNRSFNQKFVLLQKAELLIKPIVLHRFYSQKHFDTEDLPVLS